MINGFFIFWAHPHFSLVVYVSPHKPPAKSRVGLSACSCLVATSSANRLAVSSAVSPASRSFTKCPLRQATTTIPCAMQSLPAIIAQNQTPLQKYYTKAQEPPESH